MHNISLQLFFTIIYEKVVEIVPSMDDFCGALNNRRISEKLQPVVWEILSDDHFIPSGPDCGG
jgi:hypothetical protein